MRYILIVILGTVWLTTHAQIRSKSVSIHNAFTEVAPTTPHRDLSLFQTWFEGDPQQYYRMSVPVLMHKISPLLTTNAYWAGYMTTQSMRKGKFGTYYFWDVQGNLRESRFFVDVNRKNKYSFKIVVPRL